MKKLIVRVLALALAAMMLLASSGLAETIRFRDKSNNVLILQTALQQLGYYEGELDGIFGKGTLAAVKAFQKDQYMKVDGLAGWATQAKLESLTGVTFEETEEDQVEMPEKPKTIFAGDYRTMQFGTSGNRVRILQRALLALGFDVKVDGSYGSTTHAAVKAFQKVVGLTQDGKAGKKTLTKLESYFDANGNCISGPIAGNKPADPEPDPSAPIYGIPERTLRFGYTGQDVKYTMQRLYDLGYYNKKVDDKFGSGMLKALKAFQKKNGLVADGVVGPKTIKVLFSANALDADDPVPVKPEPEDNVLNFGDSGDKVIALQERLAVLGYYTGKVDGKFGKNTQTAVKLFQARNGLAVDGKVGPRTQLKLDGVDAVPAK
ncbi:MAG: peptidoglycan-binding protein [Clostridia bacterium]|nr:peptidoglycan-binding protein [Clostridia bacterium]